MSKIYFEVEGDVVFKHTPMPTIGENIYKTEVVMTKEIFQECYKKWVEEQEGEKIKSIIDGKEPQYEFKALEERDELLDKIRAEISDFEEEVFQRPNTDYSDYAAVRHCLEIIDRYKERSE